MIRGRSEIRDAYRDDVTAREYISHRFERPLGALLHARQVAAVRRILRTGHAIAVLEIAPGPARVTVDVTSDVAGRGTLVDSSREMLREAARRLGRATPWRLIQGDVFNLPLCGTFDLVYSFRLIRHFERAERQAIYRQVAAVTRPGARFVFDAVNQTVSAVLRARARPGEYRHFDALLDPDTIRDETTEAGFIVESLEGVQRNYSLLQGVETFLAPRSRVIARAMMESLDRLPFGQPLEWIVTCRRR